MEKMHFKRNPMLTRMYLMHRASSYARLNVRYKEGLMSRSDKTRILNRSLMQIEFSQPEGKWIMPETRFIEFPALLVDLSVGISRSASDTDV